jgi:hypothetical protein
LKSKPSKKRHEAGSRIHAHFLLGLVFDPEDEGNVFLQKFCRISPDYYVSFQKKNFGRIRTRVSMELIQTHYRRNRELSERMKTATAEAQ